MGRRTAAARRVVPPPASRTPHRSVLVSLSPASLPDFTGYWALVKHEGMDEFLKAAGFPWVVRKAADKFGGSAIDLISHSGSAMRVTSLNAKGSWARVYDVDREVVQPNAEGTPCKTTSWWEGMLRCREGGGLGGRSAVHAVPAARRAVAIAAPTMCCTSQAYAGVRASCHVFNLVHVACRLSRQAVSSALAWRAPPWGCSSRGATSAATAWRCAPRCACRRGRPRPAAHP